MATRTSDGRAQDRSKVAARQDHEVRYESEKIGAPCLNGTASSPRTPQIARPAR